jgi:hypothetical protein
MELYVSILTSDQRVSSEITKAKIKDGITIQEQVVSRAIYRPAIDFVVYVAEHVALPVAASLLAKLLYDKLKARKDNELTINNKSVEINAEKIEQLIINISKEEKV